MSTSGNNPSFLMLEECFVAGDDRFLEELKKVQSAKVLQAYSEKLTSDLRPWARRMLLQYLDIELSAPGHQTFFKRVFRHAESSCDHKLMAAFMVTLDRLVRRHRIQSLAWDPKQRRYVEGERLFAAPNAVPLQNSHPIGRRRKKQRLFSQKTRAYLRRRVWRYFRWLSYRDPNAYLAAMTQALMAYRDEDFAAGENILDNWSLMHLCYFKSHVLQFTGSHCNLVVGKSLGELIAAPYHAPIWSTDEGFAALTSVLAGARSSLVRVWTKELLERDHRERLSTTPVQSILAWIRCDDQTIQRFALDVFEQHPGLPVLPIATWLEFLQSVPVILLPVVCRAMTKHVALVRLSNEQVLQLSRALATPVAELGFEFLQKRHIEKPMSAQELSTLGAAKCEAAGTRLTEWVLGQLNRPETYSIEFVCEFFDSQNESCRDAAMDWIEHPASLGYHDSALWARLTETPFDDVRTRLIRILQQRTTGLNGTAKSLDTVWCSVLLGVHRGGREKLLAMDQIRNVLEHHPERVSSLMPVVAVAARSLRAPERRRALSTFASLLRTHPSLSPSIGEHIPELLVLETA